MDSISAIVQSWRTGEAVSKPGRSVEACSKTHFIPKSTAKLRIETIFSFAPRRGNRVSCNKATFPEHSPRFIYSETGHR